MFGLFKKKKNKTIKKTRTGKSKVVSELTEEFDRNIQSSQDETKKYREEEKKQLQIFRDLLDENFISECDELMRHFDEKLNNTSKNQKCGLKYEYGILQLRFYASPYTDHYSCFWYRGRNAQHGEKPDIIVHNTGEVEETHRTFSMKQVRDAQKHFLRLMTKNMSSNL